jgi:hypothetical protein
MSEHTGIDCDEIISRGMGALVHCADEFWVAGHFGAAMICGGLLLKHGALPEGSARKLADRLRETVAGDPARYEIPKPGPPADPTAIHHALESTISIPRNSGHGTIFAAMALRVFRERPDLQTGPIVEAVAKLPGNAQIDDASRYYDVADHSEVPDSGEHLEYEPSSLIRDSISELEVIYPDQTIDEKRFFYAGEKLHLVTHAHALIWLADLGHKELARTGLRAHQHLIEFARQQPPAGVEPISPSKLEPDQPDFWNRVGDPWHDIKFAHATCELMPRLSPDDRARVQPALERAWGVFDHSGN